MSDILKRICADKRTDLAARKRARPESALEALVRSVAPPRGFHRALVAGAAGGRPALICEIKKASPSKGLIRKDFDPPNLARAYLAGGASCLSVLTDARYFQGKDEDLTAARAAVDLPVLRKDFMLDPYQILESRALGADCVLLILAALSDPQAAELEAAARALAMDVLIEVHDRGELDRALRLKSPLVGINNRNLKTLEVDLATCEALAPRVPAERLVVAESGLATPGDLARMQRAGAKAFLVGESLMRQGDVAAATAALLEAAARDGRPAMAKLNHLDKDGRAAMVDVSAKAPSERVAVAKGSITMMPATLALIQEGGVAKGDVLSVARLAGIMGAKRTPDLIPLCHPLALASVQVELTPDPDRSAIDIAATCKVVAATGVEMEALTAVAVAALTVYDMCKAVDRGMTIGDIRLVHKSGGKSGTFEAP